MRTSQHKPTQRATSEGGVRRLHLWGGGPFWGQYFLVFCIEKKMTKWQNAASGGGLTNHKDIGGIPSPMYGGGGNPCAPTTGAPV